MSSDLRILLLGGNDDTTVIGNSLLGKKLFEEYKREYQRGSVKLIQYRNLHVTCAATGSQISETDGVRRLSDKLVTEINTGNYDALVFAIQIKPDLIAWYPTAAECMLKDSCLINMVSNKGIIVVTEESTFTEARKSGKISDTFMDWMRKQGAPLGSLFKETEEKCLLFATDGSEDVLAKQRSDIVHMIDTRILGGCYYTDMKFTESQKMFEELLSNLKQELTSKSSELDSREKSNHSTSDQRLKQLLTDSSERKAIFEAIEQKLDINTTEAVNRAKTIESNMSQLNEKLTRIEDSEKLNSTTVEKTFHDLRENIQKKFAEREVESESIKQKLDACRQEAVESSEDTEKQLLELRKFISEEVASIRQDLKDQKESSILGRMKSVTRSVSHLTSPWRISLLLLVILLVSSPFQTPYLLSESPTDHKGITALDESQNLRRYVEAKFEQTARRFEALEKQLTHIKVQGLMKKENQMEKQETDTDTADQSVVELLTELKEELRNETTEQLESMRKTISRDSIVWGMVQSLPLALLLIVGCALLISTITPMRIPLPWTEVVAILLLCVLILQPMLLFLIHFSDSF